MDRPVLHSAEENFYRGLRITNFGHKTFSHNATAPSIMRQMTRSTAYLHCSRPPTPESLCGSAVCCGMVSISQRTVVTILGPGPQPAADLLAVGHINVRSLHATPE